MKTSKFTEEQIASARARRTLSKAQLLPLPAAQVRRLSLKHHCALASLLNGHGSVDGIVTLSNVLELAFRLRDEREMVLYREAQAALSACVERAGRGDAWGATDDERRALEALLVAHDAQLTSVPAHRYLDALERVQRECASGVSFFVPDHD
ncbi:hypothetical protein [Burkholderia seminalis]|uniref:Fis family transcriptional regulator n=2 Tax=Burkholderia cepacia complex TaxID=87882 RepID=A0A8A8DGW1_9BURK|nr:hypothetical protein [Burkholderia seminalis]QTO23909.1 hypothetical protein DT99_032260 [Burkholderia seminalis]